MPLDVPCHPREAGGSSPSLCHGYVRCRVTKKLLFKALNMERSGGCPKKSLALACKVMSQVARSKLILQPPLNFPVKETP